MDSTGGSVVAEVIRCVLVLNMFRVYNRFSMWHTNAVTGFGH
jgi:hypothetical protein